MPLRLHTCQFPMCIHEAFRTCPKCHAWLCPDHLHREKHMCRFVAAWGVGSPAMNVPSPGKVEVRRTRKGGVRVRTKSWWEGSIER